MRPCLIIAMAKENKAHVALSCFLFQLIYHNIGEKNLICHKTTVLKMEKCFFFLLFYFNLYITFQLHHCTLRLLLFIFIIHIYILNKINDLTQKVSNKLNRTKASKMKSYICSIQYMFRSLDHQMYRHFPKQVSAYRILIIKTKL